LSKVVVFCGDCGKELYKITNILKDKPSPCPHCKSTKKFYVTDTAAQPNSVEERMKQKYLRKNI